MSASRIGRSTSGPTRRRRRLPVALVAVLAMLASACGTIVDLELPELAAVPRVPPEQSIVYDADGNQLAVLRREFRERVELDDIPQQLIDAVVSAEDQRFHVHAGLDGRALVRAAASNLAAGEVEQGGSTITQQLVKNLYMPDAERTPATKVREALLARQVEEELTKDEILEEYLNTVYFGNGAYGVQAAAETYWRKEVHELTLAESALLAGIIRSPEAINPERSPEAARERRDQVLRRMVEDGVATAETADRAAAAPVSVMSRPPIPEVVEPHWVDFVVRYLLDDPRFGDDDSERAQRLYGGGLRIHTTLRPDLQAKARAAIADFLPDADDPEASIVTVDPETGHVLAAIGGRDYSVSQFDLATQGRRQPGSTFKTFVLAAAVTSGMGPDEKVDGSPGRFDTRNGPWTVRNYAGARYGVISLAQATQASVNGAYARLILDLGVERVAAMARAMGVRSPINEDAPIALGGVDPGVTPLDMASAYATLAANGRHVDATPIAYIEDADGEVVYRPDEVASPVLSPSAAFVVTDMLRGAVESGTGVNARISGWEVAGKTGTTTDNTDAWFVGYTPTLSTAVWIGHPEGRIPLRNVRGVRSVTGGTTPARMWRTYMTSALEGTTPVGFSLPASEYEMVDIDPRTGLRSAPWCAGEPTPVPRVLVPRETCPSPKPGTPLRPGDPGSPTPTPEPTPTGGSSLPPFDSEPSPTPSPTSQPEGDPSPTPGPTGQPSPEPSGSPSPTASQTPSPRPQPSPEPEPSESEPQPEPSPSGSGDAAAAQG